VTCSKCSAENAAGAKFCIECGETFKGRCPRCGFANPANAKFCQECGTSFGSAAEAKKPVSDDTTSVRISAGQPADAVEGERKTVTALFADIKGSTELMADLDPQEARAIVDPALKLMIDAVHRYDGYVVQSTGDGIFALFGAPVAHEDHPQRALYAALRMQEELRRYGANLQAEGRAPTEIRVGVNTGEVVVRAIATGASQVEYTPIGHTTNLASRMQSIARTGSIVVSETTRKLVEGYFALKSLGASRVKGVSEPVNVYEVIGLGPLRTRLQRSAGRGLTRFVGREREIEALKHAANQAKAGHGQIVAAMAEAGTGKSRLYFEFKAKNQSGWMVLETFSVSHGKASAYLPVIDLLHGYFEITAEDDSRRRRQKILGKLLELDRALEDTVPYLYALLGIVEGDDPLAQMDGQIKKRRTLDAIKRILLRESLNQPLMVTFEDLHWIDEETQALLNLFADSLGTAKILLLVNYRPEYSHQWGSKTYYTQLRLDPLGRESAEKMLSALLGDGAEVAALKRIIIEKTEGNPFFMEETVQVLLDEGALLRNGTVKLTRPLAELKIPPTVQGILTSRIDRLPADAKDLLQTLAIIGREFPLSLIRAVVAKSDDELNRLLDDLQLGEFVYEQPAVGDTEYIFKHALTQEVAYNSVLSERRKLLHERTGRAIEALYADHLDDHLDGLVHHYSRSANAGKAINYLHLAARQCAMRTAHLQALTYLNRGLELLKSLPESPERARQELAFQIAKGRSLYPTQGWAAPETGRAFGRARELCERFGDRTLLFTVLQGLRLFHQFRIELETARQLGEQLLALAEELNDPAMLRSAQGSLGLGLLWMGELVAAREHLERMRGPTGSIEAGLLSGAGDYDQMAAGLSLLAWDLAILGYFDQAMKVRQQVLTWAQGLSRPYALMLALLFLSLLDHSRGDVQEALDQSAGALGIAAEYGFPQMGSMAAVIHGWARSCRGEPESGIAEMHRGIAGAKATSMGAPTYLLIPLAETYARIGRTDEASRLLADALETAHQTGQRLQEAELYRLEGELLLKSACNEPGAEACLRQGIEIARGQSAKWWDLRATTSLARLLRNTNRRDEARTILAEIYNWFTEGFDTADLKEAKALLDELSA
jgi:class 3 adenylate cyclase/tetratricopeptide (TPR) repeat protein